MESPHQLASLLTELRRRKVTAEYAVFARQTGRAEGRMARMHAEALAALVRLTRERWAAASRGAERCGLAADAICAVSRV